MTDRTEIQKVAQEISEERFRQVNSENFDPNHDDEHTEAQLASAACCYAHPAPTFVDDHWPDSWDEKWWKPEGSRHNLIKAAALIIAEINRLDRLEKKLEAQDG